MTKEQIKIQNGDRYLSVLTKALVGLSNVLLGRTTKRHVSWAVMIFFLIKVVFISAGAISHKNTRLGDDGLTYLWFSKSNFTNNLFGAKGVLSLQKQATELKKVGESEADSILRLKGAVRVSGHPDYNILPIFSGLETLNWSFYQMFWVQEFLVLIILSLALWVFFRNEYRPRGLLLLIPLLAFGRLPSQGLHFLVPSVMALAFGMLVWGLLAGKRQKLGPVFFATVASLMTHIIGLAYGGLAGILVIFRWLTKVISFRRAASEVAVLLAALAILATFKISNVLGPTFGPLPYGISVERFGENFVGFLKLLLKFFRHDVVVTVLVFAGGGYVLTKLPLTNFYKQVILILLALILATFFFSAVGDAGDVGIRISVPVFLVFYCFSGNFFHSVVLYRVNTFGQLAGERIKTAIGVGIIVAGFLTIGAFVIYTTKNLATRWSQLDRADIAKQFQTMPADAHVLYTDTELALEAAFLAGAHRFKSSAWPYLEKNPALGREWYARNQVDYVILLTPRGLQPESRFKSLPLKSRPYGFRLNKNRILKLRFGSSSYGAVNDIKFKITENVDRLKFMSDSGCQLAIKPAQTKNWFELVRPPCLSAKQQSSLNLKITGKGFVAGIITDDIRENVTWPWGKEIAIELRQEKWFHFGKKSVKLSFLWPEIFKNSKAERLFGLLKPDIFVAGDTSGLLLLEVRNK